MDKNKIHLQLVWGILLTLMGIAFFFKIPQVADDAKTIETFGAAIGFVYFCLYMIDLILIVGGAKKIYANLKALKNHNSSNSKGG